MHSPIERNVLQHKINTNKLKPGLVVSYDIQPGNGEGLLWFWLFINLSLTYLLKSLTDLRTAMGPTWGRFFIGSSH